MPNKPMVTKDEIKEGRYLGDGVYVQIANDQVRLWTSNGIRETNEIYLDEDVWAALMRYQEGCLNYAEQIRLALEEADAIAKGLGEKEDQNGK